MRLSNSFIFHSILLIVFLQFNSHPQTIQSEIKNLSEGADIILTGKVITQNSAWDKEGSRIFTNVVIQAEEYIKGDFTEKTIVLTTPGGEVGEIGELYSHVPRFSTNEDVLLFLKKDKKNVNFTVFDGESGKITLYNDKMTGEKITSRNKKITTLKNEIKNYIEKQ